MKKIQIFLLSLVFVGCAYQQETGVTHQVDENSASKELAVNMDLEVIPEFGDANYMFDTSDYVVLASLDSIDGGDT